MNVEATRRLLAGLAAGDALGVSSEFMGRTDVEKLYDKHRMKVPRSWPFALVGGGPFGFGKGVGSDDTDMAWAMVKPVLETGGLVDPAGAAKEFLAWLDTSPRDVGSTTRMTVGALRNKPWHESGYTAWLVNKFNAANGSLMRNGVIPGLVVGNDVNELFRATVSHSIITHYHPLPVLCCALHSWIIADEMSGWEHGPLSNDDWFDDFFEDWNVYIHQEDDEEIGKWIDRTRGQFQEAGDLLHEADFDPDSFNPFQENYSGRSGYCLLTLQIGVWALEWSNRVGVDAVFDMPDGMPLTEEMQRETKDPFDILAWVALIGHDSDTYGATAGPLLAAAHEEIPAYLTEGLDVLLKFDELAKAYKCGHHNRTMRGGCPECDAPCL